MARPRGALLRGGNRRHRPLLAALLRGDRGCRDEEGRMTTRIVILGAGGNSLGILDAIAAINAIRPTYEVAGILDDIPENQGRVVLGAKVLGPIDGARKLEGCRFVNGISSVASFRKIPEVIRRTGIGNDRFET